MILTNKLYVEYDMERIDKDFDVFLVTKPGDFYKTNILDLATEQFQARSVQYSFGAKALVLFDKNHISEQAIKEVMAQICRERDEYEAEKARKKAEEEAKAAEAQKEE